MTVWVLILTYLVPLMGVDVIAQHTQFLFESEAACLHARPVIEAQITRREPQGYGVPLTARLTECLSQLVLSKERAIAELEDLR